MTRILPCPFCGREPATKSSPGEGTTIDCITSDCIRPHVCRWRRTDAVNRRNGVDLEQVERDQELIRNRGRV